MHKIIIICGPTGVGKTTIAKELFKIFPLLKPSVTYTTRPPRPSAIEDKKMIHLTEKKFEEKIKKGEFLEYARVHNHYYGTVKKDTLALLKTNPILFNIDIKGAEQITKQFPKQSVSIFILPESTKQLINHVKNRGTISKKELNLRLKTAKVELAKKDLFDYQVTNHEGQLTETIKTIGTIIKPHVH